MPKDLVLDFADGPRDEERRLGGDTVIETYSPIIPNDNRKGMPILMNSSAATEATPLVMKTKSQRDLHSRIDLANNLSLFVNVSLCVVKLYAFIMSHSLSVLASLMDSVLDLLSQLILFATERDIRKPIDETYPAGRSRLEPVGIIICSALMGMAAIEVIKESTETFIQGVQGSIPTLDMSGFTVGVLLAATAVKLALYFLCVSMKDVSGNMMTLAEDHRNDVLSNMVALICGGVADWEVTLWWVDPVGALIISMYIMHSWYGIAKEQIEWIVGKSADTDVLGQIVEVAQEHHDLMHVDTIRAYHFGKNFLVELEMVLPADMTVRQAHDIGIELQHKVEAFEFVERAFVHIDHDWRLYDEHKDPALPCTPRSSLAGSDGGDENSSEHSKSEGVVNTRKAGGITHGPKTQKQPDGSSYSVGREYYV